MSSLQKFHRRTNSLTAPLVYPTVALGSGSDTKGYCLGATGNYNLYVAPKSTETSRQWGSYGSVRSTTSTTNGVANTNTLYALGATAHPAAYYCKSLSTGGYNTWYLPAKDELNTLYSNKSTTPFATANSFVGSFHWSSSEVNGNYAWFQFLSNGYQGGNYGKNLTLWVRAVRRSTI